MAFPAALRQGLGRVGEILEVHSPSLRHGGGGVNRALPSWAWGEVS
jgi:hypothetical protein